MKNAHSISIDQLTETLKTDIHNGLTNNSIEKRKADYGLNLLSQKKKTSIFKIFLNQFLDPVIYILGGAFILSILFNEILEGFAILIVILITVLIGFFMEWQAKKSVEALQNLVHTYTTVIRDGVQTKVESKFLVPGDLIILETGDITPADARIVEHKGLAVKESILTGESVQTEKKLEVLASQAPISEQFNMVFKGTIISRGNGKAIVTNIGDQTAIGQINLLTQQAKKSITPLEKKLYQLSRWLIWLTLGITILIAITGFLQGKDLLLMIKTAIALAVAAIPEGLPVVATITLARGMLKLSKKKVIIKKLEAVETLGSTTIICTDKTGTLTENKMEVQKLSFHKYSISLKDLNKPSFLNEQRNSFPFKKLIDVGILCNTINTETEIEKGDSVEVALLNFAKNSGFDVWEIKQNHPEKFSIPFDTEKKLMITVNSYQDKYVVNVKGAPESVLHHCEHYLCEDSILPLKDPENWDLQAQDLAKEGLRVLSLAYKEVSEKPAEATLLKDLVFIGLVGFLDPPRKDIRDAIKTYKDAGIKVVMITGDHPETSRKIGEEIGLISPNSKQNSVLLGTSLEEQITRSKNHDGSLLNVAIFSRMLPKQKLDLIEYYQDHKEIVGMIGDGVNDAPALKKADIGIAMGIRGTEAAKEAADVILMDDKFTSTELAIRQGRTIFENIRHFVVFLLSCNLAEIISVAIAAITVIPLPLLPLQILYLNLITDIFPALALGMGKGDKEIMKRAPRDASENIMTRKLWIATVVYGLVITSAVIGISFYGFVYKDYSGIIVNNMAFYTLVLAQLLNVFNLPNRKLSFFKNEVISNYWVWGATIFSLSLVAVAFYTPILKQALNLVSLNTEQFLTILIFGGISLLITQIIKRLGLIL